MKVRYINGKSYKSFSVEVDDVLNIKFTEETAEYGGQKIRFYMLRVKCASGIEEIPVMHNFEMRITGMGALHTGDIIEFESSVVITVDETLTIKTPECEFEVCPGNEVDFYN